MKTLLKSVMTITFFAVVTRAMGFFFRIFLAWQLGAETLGIYQVAFSVFVVVLSLVSSGIPLVLSAMTAKHEIDGLPLAHQRATTSGLILSFAITLPVVGLVCLLKRPLMHLFADERSFTVLLCLLPAALFSGISSAFRGNIWGRKEYTKVSVAELFEQIARITVCVLLCLLIPAEPDQKANFAALSLGVGCLVSSAMLAVFYFRSGYTLPKPAAIKELAKTSIPITVVRVASCLVNLLIALLLPYRLMTTGMNASEAMAAYGESVGMAFGFLFLPLTLTGSFSMALVPELSGGMQSASCDRVRDRISQGLTFAALVAGFFLPLYAALGKQIGAIVYNSPASGEFLALSAVIMIPLALEQIASSMMNSLGLEKKAFINFLIGTVIMIVLLWVLTPKLGVKSLIIAMFCSYTVSTILHTIVLRERLNIPLRYVKTTFTTLLSAIPCGLLTHFLNGILEPFLPMLASVVLSGSVGMIAMFALYCAFGAIKIDGLSITRKSTKRRQKRPCTRTVKR